MSTKVLQLGGSQDWSKQYKMSDELEWSFNDFPPKKPQSYSVVLLTGMVDLSDKNWEKLLWAATPYSVFYQPGLEKQVSDAGKRFLRLDVARPLTKDPDAMIKDIETKYYFGQTGIRVNPNNLIIDRDTISSYEFVDSGHMQFQLHASDWQVIGNYRQALYVDPYRQLKVWLESQQDPGVELRIVVYEQENDNRRRFVFPVTGKDQESIIPTQILKRGQFVNAQIEGRGQGKVNLGVFHYSWARNGAGLFLVGGQRIIDPQTKEQVAYLFNPGDMRPPLNVYFSGARGAEGFEAYPLFRGMKAPTLLFTDPRLEIGQFYAGEYMEKQIKRIIVSALQQLGFARSDLMMVGISMGTYPALKYGSELQAHAIVISKSLANLGYIAKRSRMERPDEFETMFDIDRQLTQTKFPQGLDEIDEQFWRRFEENDLSHTKIFIAYMQDDDYDDQAVPRLRKTKAIKKALQFITVSYPGHHNDNTNDTVSWMIYRVRQLLREDFGRKELN